jgi:sarcosine oxidase delta subunit
VRDIKCPRCGSTDLKEFENLIDKQIQWHNRNVDHMHRVFHTPSPTDYTCKKCRCAFSHGIGGYHIDVQREKLWGEIAELVKKRIEKEKEAKTG